MMRDLPIATITALLAEAAAVGIFIAGMFAWTLIFGVVA